MKEISEYSYFCVMADEGTDVSNIELLSGAARQCNEKLECSEIWLDY